LDIERFNVEKNMLCEQHERDIFIE
jgi:hypothetical protein